MHLWDSRLFGWDSSKFLSYYDLWCDTFMIDFINRHKTIFSFTGYLIMLKVVGRLPLNFSFKETALPNITEFI